MVLSPPIRERGLVGFLPSRRLSGCKSLLPLGLRLLPLGKGHAAVVAALLAAGANKEVKTSHGTPLEIAQNKGHAEVVALLQRVQFPMSPLSSPARVARTHNTRNLQVMVRASAYMYASGSKTSGASASASATSAIAAVAAASATRRRDDDDDDERLACTGLFIGFLRPARHRTTSRSRHGQARGERREGITQLQICYEFASHPAHCYN